MLRGVEEGLRPAAPGVTPPVRLWGSLEAAGAVGSCCGVGGTGIVEVDLPGTFAGPAGFEDMVFAKMLGRD